MNKIFLVFLIFVNFLCFSQNLVPNFSFEKRKECPSSLGEINYCYDWFALFNFSVDYFNKCDLTNIVGVPKNVFGDQEARSDSGIVGLISFSTTSNSREYVSVRLINNLQKDNFYKLTFYLSLANKSRFAIANFGTFFSKDSISNRCNMSGGVMDCLLPQVLSREDKILNDTLNWMKVEAVYFADGGENFITLGNFNNDANTKIDIFNPNAPQGSAYYYIDDVSLVRLYDKDLGVELQSLNEFCPSAAEHVYFRFRNEGVDSLDFSATPVSYTAELSVNGSVLQSVSGTISDNSLNPEGMPLPIDSSILLSFSPIDFTTITQDYRIQISATLPGDEQTANNEVDTLVSPQIQLGSASVSDQLLCFGDQLSLTATGFKGNAKWQHSSNGIDWQTLSKQATLVHQPQVSTFYRFSVCNILFSDTFKVEVENPGLESLNLPLCVAGEQLLQPGFSSDVQQVSWFASENAVQPFHSGLEYQTPLNKDTVFYLEMASASCTSEREALEIYFGECPLEIPNIFTPNGDGINDVFLYGNAEGKSITTTIFNRWGEKVIEWEGNSGWNGHGVQDGVYYYLIKADGTVFKGTVTLVR